MFMKKYYLLLFLFVSACIVAQNAADLDMGFNTFTTPENQFYAKKPVLKVLPQPDGKLIVMSHGSIARVSDNKFDTTFSTGTGFTVATDYGLSDFAIDAEGKIIVVGYFTRYNGTAIKSIIRLNTDGTHDTSFALTGTGITNMIEGVNLLPDGKILLNGRFGNYNGVYQNSFVRLNPDGSLDQTFTPALDLSNVSGTIVRLQPDNKIVVAKKSTNPNSPFISLLYRLNSDGSIDSTFTSGDINIGNIKALACQSDGKIIVSGDFITYNGTTANCVLRVNADGSIDTDFHAGQGFLRPGYYPYALSIIVQPDGKLVLGGNFTTYDSAPSSGIVRLNTDGSLDTTFDIGSGFQYNTEIYTLALMPDGKIIAGGNVRYYDDFPVNYITRINTDGSRDATFTNFSKGLDYSFNTYSAEQADGKILLSGDYGAYNDVAVTTLIRLNIDGSLDSSFSVAGSGFSTSNTTFPPYGNSFPINSIVPLSDGKVLIGGSFTNYNGTTVNKLVRLNSDGSLDSSFINGMVHTNDVSKVMLQPDGKILIWSRMAGSIIRLNPEGSLDSTFQSINFSNNIRSFALQPDGKILVEGNFSFNISSVNYKNLVRFNSNGTLDTSFQLNFTPSNTIYESEVQPDGKILFITTESAQVMIKRVNSNGSLDTTFSYPFSSIGYSYQYVLLHNGKILVSSSSGLKRLNPNGSVDDTYGYDSSNGFDGAIDELLLQNDGKLIVIGSFEKYRGIEVGKIARLMGESAEPLSNQDFAIENFLTVFPNPANDALNISKKQDIEIQSFEIYNALGQLIMTIADARNTKTLDISNVKPGHYFLKIRSEKGITNTRFIKL